MRSCVWLVVTIAITVAPGCLPGVRTYPYLWQVRGSVVAVSDTDFKVRPKNGQVIDLPFDDQTVFIKNKQPATWRALLRGTRVTVDVETPDHGVNRATRVQVFGGGRPW